MNKIEDIIDIARLKEFLGKEEPPKKKKSKKKKNVKKKELI